MNDPEYLFNRAIMVAKVMAKINVLLEEKGLDKINFDTFLELSFEEMLVILRKLEGEKHGF